MAKDSGYQRVMLPPIAHLGQTGTICIYSPYERVQLQGLAKAYPEHAEPIAKVLARMWDVQRVLAQHYYHPDFAGSYSLKQVVPVLCPALRYDALEIQDGKTASVMYETALGLDDSAERGRIFGELKMYCAMDTKAMVEIRAALTSV